MIVVLLVAIMAIVGAVLIWCGLYLVMCFLDWEETRCIRRHPDNPFCGE